MTALRFYKRLRDAGVDEATAMLCAEGFDAEVKIAVDAILEPRRAKDRERKAARNPRNSAEAVETAESEEAPLPLPSSPQTPQQPTPTPGDINTRVKPAFGKSNGFARFWEAYPNKVGKAAAEKSYGRALGKIGGPDPPAVLLAGVERAKASREWREGFIPHPTTWLNQGRWDDEPAEIPQPQARKAPHERPHHDAKFDARQANLARAYAGSERAIGRDWEP